MTANGGAPEYLYIIGPFALVAFCVYLRPCLAGQHSRPDDAYTALLSPSVRTARNAFERRVALAVREAKHGFETCVGCGFTNNVRARSCALCGAAIEPKPTGLKSYFRSGVGPTIPLVQTSHQRRVRRRNEWTRYIDAKGRLIWCRNSRLCDARLVGFPSYVIQAKRSKALELCASVVQAEDEISIVIEPSGDTGAPDDEPTSLHQVAASLNAELALEAVTLTAVIAGGAATVPGSAQQEEQAISPSAAESVGHARLDFPSKLAQFITSTSALFNEAVGDVAGIDSASVSRLFIDRKSLLHDSIAAISTISAARTRGAIRVQFTGEQGIDAGGVYREWFLLLNQELVKPDAGVFVCVDQNDQTLYLNPHSNTILGDEHLAYFLATGRLIGRALLEGNVTGFHLALPLLKIVLGIPVGFRDLEYFDPVAYKSMLWLVENDDVDSLGLSFTVVEKLPDGSVREVELMAGGRDLDVTDANKLEFIDRKLKHLLFESVSEQLTAFLKGVYEVVPAELLVVFDAEELDYVLTGSEEIDVKDWESHSVITMNLAFHPASELFWTAVQELSPDERRRLLQFATGSTRVPPGGFGALTSNDGQLSLFTLKGVPAHTTRGYFYSHACFNTLDVPMHGKLKDMREALAAAISGDSVGFTTA